MFLIPAIQLYSGDLRSWRDTPLFCSKVEDNHLPPGNYTLVRSYRNFTQLVVAHDSKIILYTDRDNRKDSEIFVSAYSSTDGIHLEAPALHQHEFNLAVEKSIMQGDNSTGTTIPFPGGDIFFNEIKKGAAPEIHDNDYYIYLKENGSASALLTINQTWKKLTLRSLTNEERSPSTLYSIYIDECYDKNIKKIITGYMAIIKKIN